MDYCHDGLVGVHPGVNQGIKDLYRRVPIGAKVVCLTPRAPR